MLDDLPLVNDPVHVSQTPAPLDTRPKINAPQVPVEPKSVLNEMPRLADPLPTAMEMSPGMDGGPQGVRSRIPARQIASPSNFRRPLQDNEKTEEDTDKEFTYKSCDEFREELLRTPVIDIPLDISPPPNEKQASPAALHREWTDLYGNVVASGSLVELRRGYVIIDTINGRQKISIARIGEPDLAAVATHWQIPTECLVSTGVVGGRCWEPQTVTWYASNICHKPLYFENVQLERYGHSAGPVLGPVRAAGHFFGSVLLYPYHTAINPPNECQYPLGYYRPGNCAPWLVEPIPLSLKGAAREAAVITGGWFLF